MREASESRELETGARVTIDLAAIAANWRLLAERAAPGECAAVVKADAYGLGIGPVARTLWNAGARTFFVAQLLEARRLREVLPDAVVYVLGGLPPGSGSVFSELGVRPVLGSLPEIEEWAAFTGGDNSGDAAIHVDTGMNRLGLTPQEANEAADRFADGLGFQLSLVMSHLACADESDHPLTGCQLEVFRSVAARFPGVPASLANSAAVLSNSDYRFDLCRPGIALYGGNPFPGAENPLHPVVRLEARVIQIRRVAAGDSVGYGAAETMPHASLLAVLSVGYADGFLRSAGSSDGSGGADVVIAGQRCPVVGRVSMDLLIVDITALPHGAVRRGDYATLIGDGIDLNEIALRAGTISYEILTGLGPRYTRFYTD